MVDMQYPADAEQPRDEDPVESDQQELEQQQEQEPIDRMSDLLARSAQRRQQQADEPERFTGSWFDPDPAAITRLPAHRHPVTAYIRRTRGSKKSRQNQRYLIRTVLAFLTGTSRRAVAWEDVMAYPWHHVGPDEAQDAYRALVAAYPNLNTRHNLVQMLRSLVTGCRDAKLVSAARHAEVVEELPTTSKRGVSLRRRRITAKELAALMSAAGLDLPIRAARDRAIIAVFATTGIRVSELVALDLEHWNRDEQILVLAMTKNGRPHAVPVDPRTEAYLQAWLDLRGTASGPLFVSTAQPRAVRSRLQRLSTAAVLNRIVVVARRACLGRIGTHDFRRTVASTLLRTTDAALVSRLLGHSSLAATLVYDMATEDEQRHAISTLPLPEPDDVEPDEDLGDDTDANRRAS